MIKRKVNIGDIVKVPFDNGYFTYAQFLTDTMYSFYDCKRLEDTDVICSILNRKVLFTVSVDNSAVSNDGWSIIGSCEIPDHSKENPSLFQEEIALSGKKPTYLIYKDGISRRAKRKECIGLEYFFVWDAKSIEERLRDHYEGRPNRFVESTRIKT